MTWQEAIKRSDENTAVLLDGDFCYLRYPNGSVFHARTGSWNIIKKCHKSVDGNWEPLGRRIAPIPKDF